MGTMGEGGIFRYSYEVRRGVSRSVRGSFYIKRVVYTRKIKRDGLFRFSWIDLDVFG